MKNISLQALKRLPIYLELLEKNHRLGINYISSGKIAEILGLSEISVKKDLACITSKSGKPKIGHLIIDLINDIQTYLGYNNVTKAVLVGVGRLGSALLGYDGFKKQNLEIVLAFDINEFIIGTEINSIKIVDDSKMEDLCHRLQVHIGIITTNPENAQEVCNRLINSGIKAIWNFAPITLKVPDDVIVQNENLASSFAVLSNELLRKNKEE